VGYGSGVAVQENVVLTAAHMIFDDESLSYVSQAYWYFQEEAGVFAPDPLPARGWYVLSGYADQGTTNYAAQRTNDLRGGFVPNESSPQSRNMDVAALYFLSPVANGGYGGYLPSDGLPNPWLTSTTNKMLVGYPMDGSQFGITNIVSGEMYVTGPQTNRLSPATNLVNGQQEVYTASWFLSYPGNSGGPFYVEFDGYYYPAGVYLGTLYSGKVPYASAVRAIDSNVVKMITLAASLGDSGTNYSGGGVLTIFPVGVSTNHPGYLVLQLGPPAAVQAGAAWKLTNQPDSYYLNTNISAQEITTTNALALQFKKISGWNFPTNRSVVVVPGPPVTNTAFYTATNPLLSLDLVNGLRLSGNGATNTTYQIQRSFSLEGGTWVPFKTNTVISNGFNLITNHPTPGFYRALWLTN